MNAPKATDWVASTPTGTVFHLMHRKLAEQYKAGNVRVERLYVRCGQRTRKVYITPNMPLAELNMENPPMCEKCMVAGS